MTDVGVCLLGGLAFDGVVGGAGEGDEFPGFRVGEQCVKQAVVQRVTGAHTVEAAKDRGAGEVEVADRVENLVTHELVVETEAAVAAKLDFLWDFTSSAAAIEDPSKLPKADLRKLLKEYEEENTICSRSMRRQFDKIVAACGDAHERQEALAAQRAREAAKTDRERFKATCPCCCCCPCALRHGTSGGGFYLSV